MALRKKTTDPTKEQKQSEEQEENSDKGRKKKKKQDQTKEKEKICPTSNVEEEKNIQKIIVEEKSGFNTIEVVIIMIIAILFGGLLGSILTFTKGFTSNIGVPSDLDELVSTYHSIMENYYDDLDKEELLDSAIKGMVDYLGDPYSVYMDKEESESFNETVNGEYNGIGAQVIQTDGKVMIYSIFENSPAEKAGLKKDDIILEVEGKSVEGKTLEQITAILKGGKEGSKVKVKIKRGEKEKVVTLVKDTVELTSVSSHIMEKEKKKVGVIRIDVFAANTYKQFKKELSSLEKDKIDALIIDVRSNPGGHLTQVTKILSLFMNKKKVLYQIEVKGKRKKVYASTNDTRKYPVVVLADKGSASASEILAAAMKESYGAKVIGVNTYGKGTVQNSFSLESGASIKYTTEKWLTPSGKSVSQVGVTPDIQVELSEEYTNNPNDDTDNQLQTALTEIVK